MGSGRWGLAARGRPERGSRVRRFGLLALLFALLLLASACGASDDTESGEDSGSEESSEAAFASAEESEDLAGGGTDDDASGRLSAGDEEAMADEEVEAAEESDESAADDSEGPLGAGGTRVTPTASDLGRKLIFTAVVNVEVEDVAAASAEATSIIESMGGFLFGQNTIGGSQATSELVFKVLPDDFNRALEQLGTVGELRNQSVTTDDVTERIVDLGSRIEVADLGVARLRAALEGAPTLEDYAEIERLLLDRESNLEVMRGQLRTLEDRVDLSTITLILTQDRVENSVEVQISSYDGHDDGTSCPGQQQNSVEAGSDVTICFDIVNVGDQTLTQIALTDTVLDINAETELTEVFGSLEELAPGQSALVAFETTPERSLRMRTRVVAIPTDGVSPDQVGPSVSSRIDYDIRTFEPDRDPGFGDGFSTAVDILSALWVAFIVALGFLIPLLILLPFIWLAWMGIKAVGRRRPPRSTPPTAGPNGHQPPPPAPKPATAEAAVATTDSPPFEVTPDSPESGPPTS